MVLTLTRRTPPVVVFLLALAALALLALIGAPDWLVMAPVALGATQTLATADAILKDLYRGPIVEQVNYKTYMLDMIERDSDHVDFTGRRAVVPLHTQRNLSPTSIADGGTLPDPGTQGYRYATIDIKYHAAGMELTDQAIKQAKGNEGAFINLLDADSKALAKDMKKNINRQVFGDGKGTVAGLTSSPAAAATFTVTNTQPLQAGQTIDIRDIAAGTVRAAGVVIQSINRTTRTITLTTNVTATGNAGGTLDGIFLPGAYGLEMEGLRSAVGATGVFHGIDRTVAAGEFWRGKTRDAAAATAGESLFEQLIDDIGAVGLGDVEVVLTSRGIRRRLADTYQSTKRFNDAKAVEVHGGYTAIFVNEVPVISDDDAPKGWAFALRKEAFKWFEVEAPDWLKSEDGTIWHLANGATVASKRAAWQAWFVWYASLGVTQPGAIGAIFNAADDVG
jgi:hypothetical protein